MKLGLKKYSLLKFNELNMFPSDDIKQCKSRTTLDVKKYFKREAEVVVGFRNRFPHRKTKKRYKTGILAMPTHLKNNNNTVKQCFRLDVKLPLS